jgi:hypothetical protein
LAVFRQSAWRNDVPNISGAVRRYFTPTLQWAPKFEIGAWHQHGRERDPLSCG